MSRTQNQKMADAHEEHVAEAIGARKTKGSGNQWRDQTDGRHNHRDTAFAFAFDGKSTLGKGVNVTRDMWQKAKEQAGAERPLLALRYYEDETLRESYDLVTLGLDDFVELREFALMALEYEAQVNRLGDVVLDLKKKLEEAQRPSEHVVEPLPDPEPEPVVATRRSIQVRKTETGARIFLDGQEVPGAEVKVDRGKDGFVGITFNNQKMDDTDLYVDDQLIARSGLTEQLLRQKVYENGKRQE